MYIDTHCHLQFKQYDDDRPMVIGNAKKAGVKQFIVPGVDELSIQLAVELAQHHPGVVYASVGFHPYEASHNPCVSALSLFMQQYNSVTPLRQGYAGQAIKAIGEIGLDYHLYKGERAEGKKQEQRILFEEQLRLALKHKLPVIMHCRDAFEDFFSVLDSIPTMPRGVIHCFSGGLQAIRMAKQRNLFIGLDGNITYSRQLQQIIPQISLNMILLETDAPYLAPVPHRGTRNEPKYIPLVAKTVAELHDIPVNQVAITTTRSAKDLFRL